MTSTTERQQFAEQNEMSIEFVNWFFDEKKEGCGSMWFIMAAAMWEGWKGRDNREAQPVAWLAIYHGEVYDEAISITRSVVETQAERFGWESALTEVIPLYRHALPAPAVQDGWTACSERMPDADGAYWCWFGKEEPSVIQQRVCIWINRHHEWCDTAVTHWMPLPAAPESGNG